MSYRSCLYFRSLFCSKLCLWVHLQWLIKAIKEWVFLMKLQHLSIFMSRSRLLNLWAKQVWEISSDKHSSLWLAELSPSISCVSFGVSPLPYPIVGGTSNKNAQKNNLHQQSKWDLNWVWVIHLTQLTIYRLCIMQLISLAGIPWREKINLSK